jgi:transcription initiation factor TFIID subunit 9B
LIFFLLMASAEGEGTPKVVQQISAILHSMGVEDAHPRVIHQLLEFTFRTAQDFLNNSALFAEHANRDEIQPADVKMAIQSKLDSEFTGPPPREILAETAEERNSEPLPMISEKYGIRLPLERYCLTQPNYEILNKAAT